MGEVGVKPHFRFKGGVWSCASREREIGWCMGFGYTVRQAWNDWKRLKSNWAGEGLW